MIIPVVFYVGAGPVELGLVASVNRPGGKLTGVSNLNVELMPKRLALLHELVPTATIIAETLSRELQAAARTLGLQLHVLHASTPSDLDRVFETLVQLRLATLVIGTDSFFTSRTEQVAKLALRHAVPAIYTYRDPLFFAHRVTILNIASTARLPTLHDLRRFAEEGAFMSSGSDLFDLFRRSAIFVDRILKGAKPANLPVEQPTKFELVINREGARPRSADDSPSSSRRGDRIALAMSLAGTDLPTAALQHFCRLLGVDPTRPEARGHRLLK
jgi:putative ABC transport system substrate-binding protein